MLFGEIAPERAINFLFGNGDQDGTFFIRLFIFGLVLDLLILVFLGWIIDTKRKTKKQFFKRKIFLYPTVFFGGMVLIYLSAYVDKSCF